jgi:hypothetical protein
MIIKPLIYILPPSFPSQNENDEFLTDKLPLPSEYMAPPNLKVFALRKIQLSTEKYIPQGILVYIAPPQKVGRLEIKLLNSVFFIERDE